MTEKKKKEYSIELFTILLLNIFFAEGHPVEENGLTVTFSAGF